MFTHIYNRNSNLCTELVLLMTAGQKGQTTVPLILVNQNELVSLKSKETFLFFLVVLFLNSNCCSGVQMS